MDTSGPVALPTVPLGWFDYRYYVLSDGALAILRTQRDIDADYRRWWEKAQRATFPRRMPDLWAGSARLSTLTDSGESAPINIPLVRYPEIDRLSDGRWLLASSRSSDVKRSGLVLENGSVLEKDGRLSHSFPLGDGIEHVRCAPDGTIWVGYFDEGIFGSSLGSGGIVRFNAHGQSLWSYNDQGRNGDSFIDDCYALALSGDELWSCFYSAFPIVRVKDGKETSWANSVSGAKAIAVDGSFVLLAGGYGADANRVTLLKLAEGEAQPLGSYEQPGLENAALMSGRSSAIHVVSNGTWTRITVEEVRSHLC